MSKQLEIGDAVRIIQGKDQGASGTVSEIVDGPDGESHFVVALDSPTPTDNEFGIRKLSQALPANHIQKVT